MIRYLLTLEWLKYRNNGLVKVLLLFFVISQSFLLLTGKKFPELPPPLPAPSAIFEFPSVYVYQGYIGNWLAFILLGFLAIYMTSSEFSSKTFRQNLITGLSRSQMFQAKLYTILMISTVATLLYWISCLAYGLIHTPDITIDLITERWEWVLRYWLMCLGYMSFAWMLAVVFRRSALATIFYLTYVLFLEPILRWAVHYQLFNHRSMLFYPMNAIEDLEPNPFFEYADAIQQKDMPFPLFLQPWEAVLTSSIYIVIFLFITYRVIRRADL
ncbi:MAG: ABC transporter permease [Saprospiraceae bacterium]|nr:ABC transporter permease [Saprospiraceae bacterium]MCB9319351.1 ABC transporter permease [Lewinellaceae bacterium]